MDAWGFCLSAHSGQSGTEDERRRAVAGESLVRDVPTGPGGIVNQSTNERGVGVGSLKKVWRIFNKKLPSDNDVLNQRIWMATMMLHNFRVRVMRIGQMSTVFMPDDHDYCW